VLETDPKSLNADWEDVILPHGAAILALATDDNDLLDWVNQWVAFHNEVGTQDRLDATKQYKRLTQGYALSEYCGTWGPPLVFASLAERTGKVDPAIDRIIDVIFNHSIRLRNGVIAHGGWEEARSRVWVDTMFYTTSVLAFAYTATGNQKYAEEAVQQALRHAEVLQDDLTGGFFHDSNDTGTHRTLCFWGRGNGWAILALADALDRCPPETPGWAELRSRYCRLAACMLRYQHPCGLWRTVIEREEAALETSGSAMITLGLAIGQHRGWLDADSSGPIRRAFLELLTWIDRRGAFKGAQKPAGTGSWDQHKLADVGECTYATGFLLRLIGEIERRNLVPILALP
jgi:rhamnogalacturonyl hydrolase YesR